MNPSSISYFFISLLAALHSRKFIMIELLDRAVSKFVPADDLIVPYTATSLEDADAVVHVLKMSENDLRKKQVSGFYRDVEITPGYSQETEVEKKERELEGVRKTREEQMFTILEFHTNLDLEGFEDKDAEQNPTGIKLPYIVTIDTSSREVLSIRRNYKPEDPLKNKINYFTHFKFYRFRFLWFWLNPHDWWVIKNCNECTKTIVRCWYIFKYAGRI